MSNPEYPVFVLNGNGNPIEAPYTNWKGERSVRRFIPSVLYWGSDKWHPESQWLIAGWDLGKDAKRTFALNNFLEPCAMEPELVSVGPAEDGSVEARFRCEWAVKAMASSFADFLADAPNWRSVVVGPILWTGGSLAVTVQRADGTTPVEAVAGLKERLSLLLDKAMPVPKAEGDGTAGVLICLDDREWKFVSEGNT